MGSCCQANKLPTIPAIMSANQSVWGNSSCWGKNTKNSKIDNFGAFGQKNQQSNNLAFGAFGSNNFQVGSSGPSSLPYTGFRNNKDSSNMFSFELSGSGSGSGSGSMLTLGMESKMYSWSGDAGNSLKMETTSGGSSRTSSGHPSLDWNNTVEGVFREEIQRMAEDQNSQRNVWM